MFLLSQLTPSSPPTALPALLDGTHSMGSDPAAWTAKQHKYWQRGRMLLARFRESSTWLRLLTRYAGLPNHLAAFDISRDRSRFCAKTVGFSRNRAVTFRQMLA